MTDQAAGLVLLLLAAVVFKNYRAGTLKQWASSKFFGTGSTAGPGQQLVGAFTQTAAGGVVGVTTGVAIGNAMTAGGSGDTSLATAADLTWIRGVQLRTSVAPSWGRLVDAAAADGVRITGGGYRSEAEQVSLRASRGCGGQKAYDPACKCQPPTATPQSSEHCKGRAVDVANCARGSVVFNWLTANAGKFGWYNLPSESWHWSVSGR